MKLRVVPAVVAAVPLALGLAACGNDRPASTGHPPSVPASAPTTAEQLKVAKPTTAPARRLNRATFTSAMTKALSKQQSWRVTGKMTMGGMTLLTMDGYQTTGPDAMSMEMTGEAFQGRTARFVAIKDAAYASMPGLTPAGKYVKFKADQDADLAELFDGGDPRKIFGSFDSSLATVKFVRSEIVGGQKLDRYDVTVNTKKALAAQGKKLPAGAPKTLTYTMWLDKSHLVRRLTFSMAGVSMVMSMTDYNKPVQIKAPPASKLVR